MGCLVWVVGILVGLVLLSAWGSIVIPWQWWASPVGIVNLIATHTLLGLMVYSYRATIITCPGRVPHGWVRTIPSTTPSRLDLHEFTPIPFNLI
jgi:hypothetical protein